MCSAVDSKEQLRPPYPIVTHTHTHTHLYLHTEAHICPIVILGNFGRLHKVDI